MSMWLQARTLAIGAISGIIAYKLGLPLPWMLGSMIGTTVVAMAGVELRAPGNLRMAVIPIIGVMLGSSITAEVLNLLGNWMITLLILPVFLLGAAGASYVVYRKLGRYDQVTAFYAAMPGGLNDMLLMAGEAGGDERRVALAHAARILIVISFVAIFFGLFLGVTTADTGSSDWISLIDPSLSDYVILSICAILGAVVAKRVRLPAAAVFGPMILSAIAHIAGWVTIAPPSLLIIAAQVTIGAVIGTRFIGATIRDVGHDLILAVMGTSGMLIVAVSFAAIIAWIAGIPLSQAFLAYSPGGLTEMSLLALAMGQDAAYVSVIHVIRITMVIGAAPFVFGLASGHARKRRA